MRRSTSSSNQVRSRDSPRKRISRSRNLLIKVHEKDDDGWNKRLTSNDDEHTKESKTLTTWWQRNTRQSKHSKAIYYVGLGRILWNLFFCLWCQPLDCVAASRARCVQRSRHPSANSIYFCSTQTTHTRQWRFHVATSALPSSSSLGETLLETIFRFNIFIGCETVRMMI